MKTLSAVDLEALGVEMVLANTYHLMLRPGAELIQRMGGLHGFTGWSGAMLTDSGGFQVFSLSPKVDDDGVLFRSVYDGSRVRLTPETAVSTQEALGADIQMVLDVCPALPADDAEVRLAVERTAQWARRARSVHEREDQSLFGIVQGGVDTALRRVSAELTLEVGFDGYAIGGLSVGEERGAMLEAIEAVTTILPEGKPRYLMGVGDPVGMVEAIALGVDMFDCVLPTRLARHGTVLTDRGRLQLKGSAFEGDSGALDEGCSCGTCSRFSRSYLRHLLRVGEPTAARLLTIHNLHWVLGLIDRCAEAIHRGRLDSLRSEISEVYR